MLTEKEKFILSSLVKLRTKEDLNKYLKKYINTNGNEGTELVDKIIESLFGEKKYATFSIQYLKYAVDFYENIKNKDFSNKMERVQSFDLTIPCTERETIFVNYSTTILTLPSLADVITKDVIENLWDYDPDRDIMDYGETEFFGCDNDDYHLSSPSQPIFGNKIE
jgi:hypothetical protein